MEVVQEILNYSHKVLILVVIALLDLIITK